MLESSVEQGGLEKLLQALGPRRGRLLGNLLAFGRLLRARGLDITTGKIIDGCASLQHIDLLNKRDFYYALRANLTAGYEDLEKFNRAFAEYWEVHPLEELLAAEAEGFSDDCGDQGDSPLPLQRQETEFSIEEWGDEGQDEAAEEEEMLSYSPEEVLTTKDFSTFSDEEVRQIRRLIAKIAPKLATAISRRYKRSPRGPQIDLRRTLRVNLKYGGEIMELSRKKRKIRRLKLALLCDVSGSMDAYSRFLIQFVYGLQREIHGVQTFVFSTRLTRVTDALRYKELPSALDKLARTVPDWSGGTSIGGALREFNQGPGKDILDSRTIVIIISDGWDRGDSATLEHEMKQLQRKAFRVMWLNPLLGSPNYQPLCKGMQAALPYTHYFLPAHNLHSLVNLGHLLENLAAA